MSQNLTHLWSFQINTNFNILLHFKFGSWLKLEYEIFVLNFQSFLVGIKKNSKNNGFKPKFCYKLSRNVHKRKRDNSYRKMFLKSHLKTSNLQFFLKILNLKLWVVIFEDMYSDSLDKLYELDFEQNHHVFHWGILSKITTKKVSIVEMFHWLYTK